VRWQETREITYGESLREALREEMLRDETVFVLGEDVAVHGGDFGVTKGLLEEFGEKRVRDTPISETAIIGLSLGAALVGMRPVAEIMFSDFLGVCMDQILNQVAKMRYMSGGQVKTPMVIRTAFGAGISAGPQHSQSPEAMFMHIPSLQVVIPSNPYDAKGLLKTAIRSDSPTMFFEHKLLYNSKGQVPETEYYVPFGKAEIKREGRDVTVLATALMVNKALSAAQQLEKEGISAEVIDPKTLTPFDKDTLMSSVKKTGRFVVVHEAWKRCGVGAEFASMVAEEAMDYLDAPIRRVAGMEVPAPFSPALEKYVIPNENDIVRAVQEIV
jgi:pyruvate/2-oxoglutarate/acetoin dehydrogenase E1 component